MMHREGYDWPIEAGACVMNCYSLAHNCPPCYNSRQDFATPDSGYGSDHRPCPNAECAMSGRQGPASGARFALRSGVVAGSAAQATTLPSALAPCGAGHCAATVHGRVRRDAERSKGNDGSRYPRGAHDGAVPTDGAFVIATVPEQVPVMVRQFAVPDLAERLSGQIPEDDRVPPVVAADYDPAVDKDRKAPERQPTAETQPPLQSQQPATQSLIVLEPEFVELGQRARAVRH